MLPQQGGGGGRDAKGDRPQKKEEPKTSKNTKLSPKGDRKRNKKYQNPLCALYGTLRDGWVWSTKVKRFASEKMRSIEGVLSLLSSCVIPALVVVFLDNACFQLWTSFWEECTSRSRAAHFQQKTKFQLKFPDSSYLEDPYIRWSRMSGRRTSGSSRPSLGVRVLAFSSFIS